MNNDSDVTDGPGTDFGKLRDMICYFAELGKMSLGKTKLMKLLYYSDFGQYAYSGSPISGAIYSKYPRGPVPEDAFRALDELVADQILEPKPVFVAGYRQVSHLLRSEDWRPSSLCESELKTLSRVWDRWKHASASDIVSASHADAPWQSVGMYEEIPYALAHFIEIERLGLQIKA